MKKLFLKSAIAFVLVLLLIGAVACNDKKTDQNDEPTPNKITVFSDIHILSSQQYGTQMTSGLQRIVNSNEKVIGLTEAIFRTAIDDFIASDSPILVITGDLTDDGAKVAHQTVARELARAEAAGKRCYVINGNHDINNNATSYVEETKRDIDHVSPETFAEIYADFGYSEALVRDANSLSYTADLTNKYRLIALDCAKYDIEPGTERSVTGRHDPHITDELLAWLSAQLDKCEEDEKEPFLITHFPILSHIGPLAGSMSHVNKQADTLETLGAGGVAFSFCGHVHQQDIASYSFGSKTYYEIETGSLAFTNLPIRHFFDNGETIKITTTQQSYVNEAYIPAFYSAEEKAAMLADLPSYVWKYENAAFATYMFGKLYMDDMLAIFGIDDETAIATAETIVRDFYYMPLYEKDGGEKSLQGICKKYGVTDFPVLNDGETVGQLLATFIKSNFAGDENYTRTSPQIKQLYYALFAAADTLRETKLLSRLGILDEVPADYATQMIEDLFETGKLEVVKSGILAVITKIPKLANNSFFQQLGLSAGSSESIANVLKELLDNSDYVLRTITDEKIRLAIDSFRDDEKGFGCIADFERLETDGVGYIDFGGIVDCLFKGIGRGLLQDDGAPDNNFEFPAPKRFAE